MNFEDCSCQLLDDKDLTGPQMWTILNLEQHDIGEKIVDFNPDIREQITNCLIDVDVSQKREETVIPSKSVLKITETKLEREELFLAPKVYLKYDNPIKLNTEQNVNGRKSRFSIMMLSNRNSEALHKFEPINPMKLQGKKLLRFQRDVVCLIDKFNQCAVRRRHFNMINYKEKEDEEEDSLEEANIIQNDQKVSQTLVREGSSQSAFSGKSADVTSKKSLNFDKKNTFDDKSDYYELDSYFTDAEFNEAISNSDITYQLSGDDYLFYPEYVKEISGMLEDFEMLTESDKTTDKLFKPRIFKTGKLTHFIQPVSNSRLTNDDELGFMEKLAINRREQLGDLSFLLKVSWQDEIRMLDELIRQMAIEDWNFGLILKNLQSLMVDEVKQRFNLIESLFDNLTRSTHEFEFNIRSSKEEIINLEKIRDVTKSETDALNREISLMALIDAGKRVDSLNEEKDRLTRDLEVLKDFMENTEMLLKLDEETLGKMEPVFTVVNKYNEDGGTALAIVNEPRSTVSIIQNDKELTTIGTDTYNNEEDQNMTSTSQISDEIVSQDGLHKFLDSHIFKIGRNREINVAETGLDADLVNFLTERLKNEEYAGEILDMDRD